MSVVATMVLLTETLRVSLPSKPVMEDLAGGKTGLRPMVGGRVIYLSSEDNRFKTLPEA